MCRVYSVASKSGGAPPHSKTQAKLPRPEWRPRFGVRQCSAAFERTIHYCFVIVIAAFHTVWALPCLSAIRNPQSVEKMDCKISFLSNVMETYENKNDWIEFGF